jgi:signal transduction histidine kinase/ActR/RegA family two-component response regulator
MLRWPVLCTGAASALVLAVEGGGSEVVRAFLAGIVITALLTLLVCEHRAAAARRAPREQRFREYRQILTGDARCLFWFSDVQGAKGWETWDGTGLPPLRWELNMLDRQAMEQLLGPGCPEGELGTRWAQIRHPADLIACNQTFHQALVDRQIRMTSLFRVTTHEGKLRWYIEDIRIRPLGRDRWYCIGVCVDITERKLAEQAALETEQRLRRVMLQSRSLLFEAEVEATPDWDWHFDGSSGAGAVTWRSDPLDYEAAQLILPLDLPEGKPYHLKDMNPCRHPEDVLRMERAWREAVRNHQTMYGQEYRCINRYGQYQWLAEAVYIEYIGERHWRFSGVIQDVTSRKRAEESLREVMSQVRCIIWYGHAWREDGQIRRSVQAVDQSAAQQVVALEVPEGMGYAKAWFGSLLPEDRERFEDGIVEVLEAQREVLRMELRCKDRYGNVHWVMDECRFEPLDPDHWRLTGVCLNITERKRAELDLQGVMRQAGCIIFHGLLEVGADPLDSSQHVWRMQVADVEAAQRLVPLELKPGEDYPKAWIFSRPAEEQRDTLERHLSALRNSESRFAQSFRCVDRNGQVHWMSEEVRMEPIGPRVFRMVTVCIDMTAQKQTEQALRDARRAADEANAAKSAFLANMSHEIRTPMTAIVGYADLLSDPNLETGERDSYVRTIRRNGEHLVNVVNDILDLSRIESGKLEVQSAPCSIREIVEDVATLMRRSAMEKNLDLTIKVETGGPEHILSDPLRLRQIVLNLVGNAVKFTDRGGVSVTVRGQIDGAGQAQMVIEVADTGIGIAPDRLKLLFQPFQQAADPDARRQTGTGLGLAISRRLAQMLGGDIAVESHYGVGSRFVVQIQAPVAHGRAIEAAEAADKCPPSLRGIRVLLAEDGRDNRRLICIHLRRLGCTVKAVENGLEAVRLARASEEAGEAFDVVLMDMHMPVLDGYGATAELRARGYVRPIIALTAYAMEGDRQQCIEGGCDEYVVKPIDMVHLSRIIRKQVERAVG